MYLIIVGAGAEGSRLAELALKDSWWDTSGKRFTGDESLAYALSSAIDNRAILTIDI
jgi:hypothetical protein